jgi:uncharacterized protein YfaP (DUF2135 family)
MADWTATNDGMASVDIDDTDGAGPERIIHDSPGQKVYQVGVYYYADNGYGASYATVQVYLDGQLAFDYQNQYLATTKQFWFGIEVDWPNKTVTQNQMIVDDFPP